MGFANTLIYIYVSAVDPDVVVRIGHRRHLTFFPPDWGVLRRSRRVLIFLESTT